MQNNEINFEIRRKIFHLSSLIFPFTYLFISKTSMSIALSFIALLTVLLDKYRHHNQKIKVLIEFFFSSLFRKLEKTGNFKLSGISFMMSGFLITCLFFPKGLVITSWLILIISDCLAAIIGIKFGTPTKYGKSIAGFIAFMMSAVLISIVSYFFIGIKTSFIIIMISCFITALIEFYAKKIKINDNLTIPVTYCLSTIILVYIL